MMEFEEFGRWLDQEIQHVRKVIETEIKPTAEKKFVSALRAASGKLAQMAEDLDNRKQRPGA